MEILLDKSKVALKNHENKDIPDTVMIANSDIYRCVVDDDCPNIQDFCDIVMQVSPNKSSYHLIIGSNISQTTCSQEERDKWIKISVNSNQMNGILPKWSNENSKATNVLSNFLKQKNPISVISIIQQNLFAVLENHRNKENIKKLLMSDNFSLVFKILVHNDIGNKFDKIVLPVSVNFCISTENKELRIGWQTRSKFEKQESGSIIYKLSASNLTHADYNMFIDFNHPINSCEYKSNDQVLNTFSNFNGNIETFPHGFEKQTESKPFDNKTLSHENFNYKGYNKSTSIESVYIDSVQYISHKDITKDDLHHSQLKYNEIGFLGSDVSDENEVYNEMTDSGTNIIDIQLNNRYLSEDGYMDSNTSDDVWHKILPKTTDNSRNISDGIDTMEYYEENLNKESISVDQLKMCIELNDRNKYISNAQIYKYNEVNNISTMNTPYHQQVLDDYEICSKHNDYNTNTGVVLPEKKYCIEIRNSVKTQSDNIKKIYELKNNNKQGNFNRNIQMKNNELIFTNKKINTSSQNVSDIVKIHNEAYNVNKNITHIQDTYELGFQMEYTKTIDHFNIQKTSTEYNVHGIQKNIRGNLLNIQNSSGENKTLITNMLCDIQHLSHTIESIGSGHDRSNNKLEISTESKIEGRNMTASQKSNKICLETKNNSQNDILQVSDKDKIYDNDIAIIAKTYDLAPENEDIYSEQTTGHIYKECDNYFSSKKTITIDNSIDHNNINKDENQRRYGFCITSENGINAYVNNTETKESCFTAGDQQEVTDLNETRAIVNESASKVLHSHLSHTIESIGSGHDRPNNKLEISTESKIEGRNMTASQKCNKICLETKNNSQNDILQVSDKDKIYDNDIAIIVKTYDLAPENEDIYSEQTTGHIYKECDNYFSSKKPITIDNSIDHNNINKDENQRRYGFCITSENGINAYVNNTETKESCFTASDQQEVTDLNETRAIVNESASKVLHSHLSHTIESIGSGHDRPNNKLEISTESKIEGRNMTASQKCNKICLETKNNSQNDILQVSDKDKIYDNDIAIIVKTYDLAPENEDIYSEQTTGHIYKECDNYFSSKKPITIDNSIDHNNINKYENQRRYGFCITSENGINAYVNNTETKESCFTAGDQQEVTDLNETRAIVNESASKVLHSHLSHTIESIGSGHDRSNNKLEISTESKIEGRNMTASQKGNKICLETKNNSQNDILQVSDKDKIYDNDIAIIVKTYDLAPENEDIYSEQTTGHIYKECDNYFYSKKPITIDNSIDHNNINKDENQRRYGFCITSENGINAYVNNTETKESCFTAGDQQEVTDLNETRAIVNESASKVLHSQINLSDEFNDKDEKISLNGPEDDNKNTRNQKGDQEKMNEKNHPISTHKYLESKQLIIKKHENIQDQIVPAAGEQSVATVISDNTESLYNECLSGRIINDQAAFSWNKSFISNYSDTRRAVKDDSIIFPSVSCRKPLRLGLSKRQRLPSLHPYVKRIKLDDSSTSF